MIIFDITYSVNLTLYSIKLTQYSVKFNYRFDKK